jgi:hypothetical protein
MSLSQYLLFIKSPKEVFDFTGFSNQLKNQYKTLDGYAFDYNDKEITSIKLYYKIYTKKNIFNCDFFSWFTKNTKLSSSLKKTLKPTQDNGKVLSGLNFSIKYKPQSKQVIKSIYFADTNQSSLVINESNNSIYCNKYYYIYNTLLINLINHLFKMNMPKHKEGIEFSLRGRKAHCTVFPKIDKQKLDLHYSSSYCEKMTKKLMQFEKFNSAQDLSLFIHSKTERSSLITKGYSSNNSAQKIYFGCFDWKKSIFEN